MIQLFKFVEFIKFVTLVTFVKFVRFVKIVNFVESAQNFLKLLFRHLVSFILFIQSVGNLSHSPRLILKFFGLGIEILNHLIGRPKHLLKDMFLGS